jgi:hypothetical protein
MKMKTQLFVLAITCLGPGTNPSAQETHGLRGDEAAVAAAVVEWFGARATGLAQRQGTVVISRRTNARRLGSAVRGRPLDGVRLPEPEHFEFPAQAFRGVAKATGLRIEYCEEYDRATHALCAIAEPWEWLVFSAPAVDGDNAAIELEDWVLDHGPPGTEPQIHASLSNVYLQRKGGRWLVVAVEPTGAT